MIDTLRLKRILDEKLDYYNRPAFIKEDPISIPHLFTKKQDIEIAGFFAAIFAWGNRKTIIRKSRELFEMMGMQPYEFMLHHSPGDLKTLESFTHRTFNYTDLLYFIEFFKHHYTNANSLETAFTRAMKIDDNSVENALNGFYNYFFSLEDVPGRTRKHIACPARNAACKRINMFLRWMVRRDDRGVDFGLWKKINPSQLVCPLDLHVTRVALSLGLITRQQSDWRTAMELTENLRLLDASDPVKYDLALFGMGVGEGG